MSDQVRVTRHALGFAIVCAIGCSRGAYVPAAPAPLPKPPAVSRALQLTTDGRSLWVVNPESDSISEIDVEHRRLRREVALGPRPTLDPHTRRFDPPIRPRAIALIDRTGKAYVAGEAAGRVFVVDTTAGAVVDKIAVGAGPVSVVASADGRSVFVVCHEAATVTRIDTSTDAVVSTRAVGEHPWGLALSADGSLLYVTHLLRNAGISAIPTAAFDAPSASLTADLMPFPVIDGTVGHPERPNGESRGLFAVVPQPGSGSLWVPHLLLATGTAQPALDFQSTVFPEITVLSASGKAIERRLLFRPSSIKGTPIEGDFADVVSGPRDVAFTPDGALALVVNEQSEDVMIFDAQAGVEIGLVRPTPTGMPEGIVIDSDGTHAYLLGRNTHDVTFMDIDRTEREDGGPLSADVRVNGEPVDCLEGADPMPPSYRHGQRLFYSSNTARFPISQNFWVACASCHLEGGGDAVTWRFLEGPRDTPSNAGGPINTGFLWRQAVRNQMDNYDETIRMEQGGAYHRTDPNQRADLAALGDFTNYAIPFPPNPNIPPDGKFTASQERGRLLFGVSKANCLRCHAGDYFTDSGEGNPNRDLAGPIKLHDMRGYTCVEDGGFPDQASNDVEGHPRAPCLFDTPTLRGIFATAPYLHDGSAATLEEAIGRMPDGRQLSSKERSDLAAYLSTL